MKQRFYAGIGSRLVPKNIETEMTKLASMLEKKGFILRSGNAEGADQAFAEGVDEKAQIWLPWHSFQKEFRNKKYDHDYRVISEKDVEAFKSVNKYHPNGPHLTDVSQKFMARNYRQVIGRDEPNSEFIICWTSKGEWVGGTAQALRIAHDKQIPIINMYFSEKAEHVMDTLEVWHNV